jgi:hypothetical protein
MVRHDVHLGLNIIFKLVYSNIRSVGGVAVSIVAFQAADPGSTPGQRKYIFVSYISC